MQTTRTAILQYMTHHPGSSAADLGRFLEMTPANIRYHLGILEAEGLVQVSGQRPVGGSGRPILLYNLRSETLGENILPVLEAILEALSGRADINLILEDIASCLVADVPAAPGNRISTLNQAVAFLNEHHYRANWKATPAGPQVELRHCPYRDLAQTQQHLCRIDELVLSAIFKTRLDLFQKREFGKNPFSPCVFRPPA
jgi:predicted ArsR family transcriptional regulator